MRAIPCGIDCWFALPLDTGVRTGEALGLRHEDLDIAGRVLTVGPRPNDNRARARAGVCRMPGGRNQHQYQR
jgi:hypothetical protein